MREDIKTRNLPVKLTEEEVAAKSQALAGAIKEKEETQYRLANVQTAIKGEIKVLDLVIARLASNVSDKVEYRDVEVYEERDNKALVMKEIRFDTHEVIGTRPMSESERQLVMFPQAPPLAAVSTEPELSAADKEAIAADPEVAI